jgi:hypothetical protein
MVVVADFFSIIFLDFLQVQKKTAHLTRSPSPDRRAAWAITIQAREIRRQYFAELSATYKKKHYLAAVGIAAPRSKTWTYQTYEKFG